MKNSEFSNRIKKLIYNKGLKTRDLSALMECPEATINAWKSGIIPSIEKLKRLALILETSPAYLTFGENDSNGPIFSNSTEECGLTLRGQIERHLEQVLDEAEKHPHALQHLYVELRLRFPQKIYHNLP